MIGDSNRSIDEFGYMTVENCILTGEDVAKYFGYEIPFYKELGLDEKKIYHVYRPKDEIKDSNFSNKPLLSKHADFSAEDYKFKLIVGTVGETKMVEDQTHGTIVFWDQKAIDELDKGKKFLSCGYMYVPVLEKGFYNNMAYDLKMTNIVANHVAMVDNPRYKRAIVADEQSIDKKGTTMFFGKKKQIAKDTEGEWSFDSAMKEMKDCMSSDMSPEEKEKKFEELKEKLKEHLSPKAEDKKDESMSEEGTYGEGEGEDEDLKDLDQKKNEKQEGLEAAGKVKDKKMTGDSASFKKLVADSVAREMDKFYKRQMAFDSAIREFERVCGKVNRQAFDSSPEKVLDAILKNHRVTFDGKTFEQKQAMVEMLPTLKASDAYRATMTLDSNLNVKNHTPANIINFLKGRL